MSSAASAAAASSWWEWTTSILPGPFSVPPVQAAGHQRPRLRAHARRCARARSQVVRRLAEIGQVPATLTEIRARSGPRLNTLGRRVRGRHSRSVIDVVACCRFGQRAGPGRRRMAVGSPQASWRGWSGRAAMAVAGIAAGIGGDTWSRVAMRHIERSDAGRRLPVVEHRHAAGRGSGVSRSAARARARHGGRPASGMTGRSEVAGRGLRARGAAGCRRRQRPTAVTASSSPEPGSLGPRRWAGGLWIDP
jgi:hypothetical protein